MRNLLRISLGFFLCAGAALAANDVPVPDKCTSSVNAELAKLVKAKTTKNVDNVMVCGTTSRASQHQKSGSHGPHEILTLSVALPGLGTKTVQIAINDDLDGKVTAPANAQVFAYGQAYFDKGAKYVAGIHDVHCSTHAGADNGWIVVNGKKSPATPCK
jgi:hypothetical protein